MSLLNTKNEVIFKRFKFLCIAALKHLNVDSLAPLNTITVITGVYIYINSWYLLSSLLDFTDYRFPLKKHMNFTYGKF